MTPTCAAWRWSCWPMRPRCSSPCRRRLSRLGRSGRSTTCRPSTGCAWSTPPTCSASPARPGRPTEPGGSRCRAAVIATNVTVEGEEEEEGEERAAPVVRRPDDHAHESCPRSGCWASYPGQRSWVASPRGRPPRWRRRGISGRVSNAVGRAAPRVHIGGQPLSLPPWHPNRQATRGRPASGVTRLWECAAALDLDAGRTAALLGYCRGCTSATTRRPPRWGSSARGQ